MFKTFKNSFLLRNTYKTNSIIWAIRNIPLLGKLLPSSLYACRELKVIVFVVSILVEIITAFAGKLLYFLILLGFAGMGKNAFADSFGCVTLKFSAPTIADCFAHLVFFLTLIGGILNTSIFNPTKDKFYAIFLMRMDAKKYTLSNYLYFLVKFFVGYILFSSIIGMLLKASYINIIALPFLVLCVKLLFTAHSLRACKREVTAFNENKPTIPHYIVILLLLALAALPFLGISLPENTLAVVIGILLIPSVFAGRYIFQFDSYRLVYKDLLKAGEMSINTSRTAGATQQIAFQKKLLLTSNQTSNKSGYKYFNELFMKRHSKLLTRSAKRITIVTAIILAAVIIAIPFFQELREAINEMLLSYLPYFLFVMYLMNRGRSITLAMFMNCDHSMLTYRCYRQPKALLELFIERLKYITLINLMPASVISLGLPILLLITGGTSEPINYFLLFISIIAMSVFFSVHSMVLYYLLQPYNVNLESKSGLYSIINVITYYLCYMAIQVHIPTLIFGTAISVFCILYAVLAFLLAYKLAPKTFKLRN